MATDETLSALDPELLVRQILVKSLSTANEVIESLNNGSDFAEIAKAKSISSNAQTGGLLNWRKAVDMPELFEKALANQSWDWLTGEFI